MIQDGIEGHAEFAAERNPLEGSANLWVHTSINNVIDAVIRGNLPVSSFVLGRRQLKQTGDYTQNHEYSIPCLEDVPLSTYSPIRIALRRLDLQLRLFRVALRREGKP